MCYFELQIIFCPCEKGEDCLLKRMGLKMVHGRAVHKLGRTWCKQENAWLPRLITKPCKLAKAKGETMGLRDCPDSLREGEFDVITHYVTDEACHECKNSCAARRSGRVVKRTRKAKEGQEAKPRAARKRGPKRGHYVWRNSELTTTREATHEQHQAAQLTTTPVTTLLHFMYLYMADYLGQWEGESGKDELRADSRRIDAGTAIDEEAVQVDETRLPDLQVFRCDETWPTCHNCNNTGRRCDGVASAPRAAPSTPVVTFTAPLTLSHFPPAKASGGELGHGVGAYLDLFQRELVSCIVGSRSAWRRLVLQAVFEEPALGHAAVAFSALQKATAASPSDEGIKRFERVSPSLSSDEVRLALRHYERCIQEMQRVVGSGSRDSRCVNIVLLFDADLAMALSRLDLQASIFLGRRSPTFDAARVSSYSLSAEGGYQEADRDLTCLTSRLFSFMRAVSDHFRYREPGSVPLHVADKVGRLEDDLAAFRDRHLAPGTAFMERGSLEETTLIRVKYLTTSILLATCLAVEEAMYDCFTAQFADIVTLCAGLLDGSQRRVTPAGHRDFTLDMGIVHSLYVTACKCRHPGIRRRAMALLDAVPGAEGVWEGKEHARIGERVMQLEECDLDLNLNRDLVLKLSTDATDSKPISWAAWDLSRVPEWRRIHSVDIYPQLGLRRAKVSFRWRPNGMDGEWDDFTEVITW
ncbi:C6 finger domain protein [Purpureocillium lilacinum]|uniref:C6 finger domain protein n=1 Tax=Purpureocillium lilacinum TaxID=33203 RepID=A0A2U3EBE4_PURLI|nr:C6 finger domain protein [Purpureocillium lilacinum]